MAFYCTTGWRASGTCLYAYLMGWEKIAVYDGGWFEWVKDPINNPVETGDPNDAPAVAAAPWLRSPEPRPDSASRCARLDLVIPDPAAWGPLDLSSPVG